MNRQERGILVGMVLGDGHIRTATAADKLAGRRIAAQLTFSHSIKQREYAEHKLNVLNKIFGGKASLGIGRYKNKYSNGKAVQICHAAKSNPYFKTLKGMMYSAGGKHITSHVLSMLTPEGIAYWFMDDGSYQFNKRDDGTISSISLNISTYCSEAEADLIISYFKNAYDIEVRKAYCKKTKRWTVRMNTGSARKFAALISEYIVPSMKYKLASVHFLDSHECPTSELLTCNNCGKSFLALTRGLCTSCYNSETNQKRSQEQHTCSVCGETKSGKWRVGSRCRRCYERNGR